MLWKYKKVYQETNEDIVEPVVKCMNIKGVYNNSGIGKIEVNYYLCNSESIVTIQVPDGQAISINQCVKKAPLLTITWTNGTTTPVVPFGGAEANSDINVIQSGTGQTCIINVGSICAYE